jgi:lysophospholipase L1-like esterase
VKFILSRLALVLFGIALATALVEGAVRLVVVTVTPNVMVLDDDIGWAHRPNTRRETTTEGVPAVIETNALGLRGPLHAGPTTRSRVLVLGDSFTDGLQVSNEELFSSRWQELRPDLEIVNAGVSAYGTVQEKLAAVRWDPVIKPNLWVLMVFAGNDLTDNIMPFDEAIGPRPYVGPDLRERPLEWEPFQPVLLPIPGAAWLHRNSLAAYVVHKRLVSAEHAAEYVTSRRDAVPLEVKWAVLEKTIGELARGRRLVVAGLPTREDVRDKNHEFARHLAAVCARLHVRFVDVQPMLRPQHFFQRDFHWNAAGHRAVGTYLARTIRG